MHQLKVIGCALGGALVYGLLGDAVLKVASCRMPAQGDYMVCPDMTPGIIGFVLLGAVWGFWFGYTGRLAETFKRRN